MKMRQNLGPHPDLVRIEILLRALQTAPPIGDKEQLPSVEVAKASANRT